VWQAATPKTRAWPFWRIKRSWDCFSAGGLVTLRGILIVCDLPWPNPQDGGSPELQRLGWNLEVTSAEEQADNMASKRRVE